MGLVASKKSAEGHAQRLNLLRHALGVAAVDALMVSVPRRTAAIDDVADALAALWSAERILAGRAGSLPHPPAQDAAGLEMAIWC